MSARPKETHAIQVFPFLAVLVCTMGALIFLLLLMTRQVRQRELALIAQQRAQRAIARAEAKLARAQATPEPEKPPVVATIVVPTQPIKEPQKSVKLPDQSYLLALEERNQELDALTSKWKLKTEKLQEEREKARNALLRNKTLINAAIAHAKSVQSEVQQLEGQLEQISTDADAIPTSAAQEAEQLAVEMRIAEMKKRLRAAQIADANGANDQFQVIPFDPQSGTTRRPILIECTEAGIRFLPEGITITSADLNGFTPRVNPLAAGTAALINYWHEQNGKQRNPRAEPEPYPLLLVRPDGVVAYYVAMKYLEPIRTIHGYELIEESTALKLPELDPKAKSACETAVQRMLSERENVQRIAANVGNGGSAYGGTPRRGGGKRGGGGVGAEGSSVGAGGSSGGGGRGDGNGFGRGGVGGGTGDSRTGGTGSPASTSGPGAGSGIAGANGRGENGSGKGGPRGVAASGVGVMGGSGNDNGEGNADDVAADFNSSDQHGEGSVLDGNATFGRTGNGRPTGQPGFSLSDLDPEEERVGSRSWERIENFEGRPKGGNGDEIAGKQNEAPRGSGNGRGQGKVRNASSTRQSGPPGSTSGPSGTGASGDVDSSNTDVSDPNSTGTETSGANASGSNVSGAGKPSAKSSGTKVSGLNAAGPNRSGTNSAGATSSGVNSPGANVSDANTGGGNTAGSPAEGANGSNNGSANAPNGRSNVAAGNQERWTSPGVSQTPAVPTDESEHVGNVGSGGPVEPGMPIGKRPGSKASKSNQGSGNASNGSDSGDDSSVQNGVQPMLGMGGRSNRSGSSDENSPPRKSRGPRLSSDQSRPSGKRSKSEDSEKPIEPEMLAGRHWGYADPGASIGFERDVRVDVSADKLLIAERYEIPVGMGETRQETFELFITLLDRHAHEWGRPPQGFFWTPRLKFVVKPEGSIQYEQINSLMTRSGLSTVHEFAKNKDAVEFGRDTLSNKKAAPKTARKSSLGGTP